MKKISSMLLGVCLAVTLGSLAAAKDGYCGWGEPPCHTIIISYVEAPDGGHPILDKVLSGEETLFHVDAAALRADIDFKGGDDSKPIKLAGDCEYFYVSRWRVEDGGLKPVIWDNMANDRKRQGRAAIPLARNEWPAFLAENFGEQGLPQEVYQLRVCGMAASIAFADDSFLQTQDADKGSYLQACAPELYGEIAYPFREDGGALWLTPGVIVPLVNNQEQTTLLFIKESR